MFPQLLADIDLGFWGQTFTNHDIVVILLLVLLEGVLSIDNALVLGLLAKRVPKPLQKRALTYGLIGAFVFRVIAIATASYLLKWRIVKLLGGGYLVYIAIKHLFFESKEVGEEQVIVSEQGEPELRMAETGAPLTRERETEEIEERVPFTVPEEVLNADLKPGNPNPNSPSAASQGRTVAAEPTAVADRSFWMAVAVIELTDIAFAVDSILAAIALVGSPPAGHPEGATHPKLWVVIAGGMLGVMLMRVAAAMFIRLLEKFPRFEVSAYLLVIVIGIKLLVDWGFNSEAHPHRINFHSYVTPEFWIFWISMIVCLGIGFLPKKSSKDLTQIPDTK
jgi:predicted tellurium resistance membrane protein TerC